MLRDGSYPERCLEHDRGRRHRSHESGLLQDRAPDPLRCRAMAEMLRMQGSFVPPQHCFSQTLKEYLIFKVVKQPKHCLDFATGGFHANVTKDVDVEQDRELLTQYGFKG